MAKGIKTGGRSKGTPNKMTASLKEMILSSLHEVGGAEYLKKQSYENPSAYLTLVGKVLPLTLAGDQKNPLVTTPITEADRALLERYLSTQRKETK